MTLYLLLNRNRFSSCRRADASFIKVYTTFLAIMFFCLIANGELFEYQYFKRLLAYHLPCFVVFYAILHKVNTRQQLEAVITLAVYILLFDSVVTIFQSQGNAYAWAIGQALAPIEEINEKATSQNSVIGISIIPGIFGGVVRNAYYLCSLFPLVLLYNIRIYNYRTKLFSLLVLFIAAYAIFITQQRTAFYLILVSFGAYWALRVVKKPILIILIFAILALFTSSIESSINSVDYGRLLDTQDDTRNRIWQVAFDFIPNNWLLGAPMKFQRIAGLSAHNLVIDGIIFSGIGGFACLMLFVIKSLKLSVHGCLGYLKGYYGNMTVVLSLAFTSCILYGFFHNTSVLTGEPCIFLLLGLLLKSIELDRLIVKY